MDVTESLFSKFTAAFSIPVYLYRGDKLEFSCERFSFSPNPAYCYLHPYISGENDICFLTSHDFIFSGYISLPDDDHYLIVGPVTAYELSMPQAERVAKNLGLPRGAAKELVRYFHQLPRMSSPSFYSMLDFLRSALGLDSPVKIVVQSAPPKILPEQSEDIVSRIADVNLSTKVDERMLSLISTGQVDEIAAALDALTETKSVSPPELGPTAIRSLKNTFISATSIVARCALSGGLDYQTSISLSDLYISQVENMTQFSDIHQAFYSMMMDFASRVRLCLHPGTDSATITAVYRDVQEHRYEKITTSAIAGRLGVTCSYLCHHFKEKTGKTLTQYIHELKIEEAKYLLKATEMSLSQIALKMGYSSQQQFQQLFKKIVGVTPQQYRKGMKENV